ncbi:MAG: hypothetical protein ACI4EQ_07155 [Lachnospiraceae bacterium]
MRKTLKRLITTVLTLAMMMGVFAVGGGVQAKAAPTYELVPVGDDVTFEQAKALVANNNASELYSDGQTIKSLIENDPVLSTTGLDVLCYINEYGSIQTYRNLGSMGWASLSSESEYDFMRQSGPQLVYYYLVVHEHEHSYSWVTVREASIGSDGMEEYRCSCGNVKDSRAISSSYAYVNGLVEMIQKIPENGDAEFEAGWYHTMTDYIVEELAQRSDATIVITFEYKDVPYKMTIPSGVDYSALLADEENFYGYFYFAQLIGATIENLE